MENKEKNTKTTSAQKSDPAGKNEKKKKSPPVRAEEKSAPGYQNLLPGVPVVGDPPVPNRAWTEMRLGRDIDELSEEEKADLYLGPDRMF